jgi:peptidoglycan-associated lipoprotein
MNAKHLMLVAMGAALFFGCSKKPPPPAPPEPPPPVIQETPPPPPAQVDEDALRRQRIQARIAETFKTIYFDYDASTLRAEGRATCQAIGALMKEVPEISARLEGHADDRGTNEYNLALGERRAKSVMDYLSSYGVKASQLSVISYGEEKAAAMGQDENSWAQNRRVEFTTSF